ncbi:MAG TPA: type II secretion system protein N, partial [Rhodanobacteraceae bacterium]|nr:type II secretion system protein N [Rhodanobacteraceae bacterium]
AYGVQGTLHDGTVAGLRYRNRPLVGDVHWQLKPWWLLLGRVALQVHAGRGDPVVHGEVQVSFSTLRASRLDLDAQLKTLLARAGYAFLPIDGLLQIQVHHAALSQTTIDALNADATLHGLRWTLGPQRVELGDFTAHAVRTDKGGVDIELASAPNGPLEATGRASLDAQGHYAFDMKLKPQASASPALRQLLQGLGHPDAGGHYAIHLHGQLPWPHPARTRA